MRAVRSENCIRIYDAYLYRECIKEIPGRSYDATDKAWIVPLTEENVAKLQIYGASMEEELEQMLKTNTEAELGSEEELFPAPIKGKLFRHQVMAYNFALKLYGVYIHQRV